MCKWIWFNVLKTQCKYWLLCQDATKRKYEFYTETTVYTETVCVHLHRKWSHIIIRTTKNLYTCNEIPVLRWKFEILSGKYKILVLQAVFYVVSLRYQIVWQIFFFILIPSFDTGKFNNTQHFQRKYWIHCTYLFLMLKYDSSVKRLEVDMRWPYQKKWEQKIKLEKIDRLHVK